MNKVNKAYIIVKLEKGLIKKDSLRWLLISNDIFITTDEAEAYLSANAEPDTAYTILQIYVKVYAPIPFMKL